MFISGLKQQLLLTCTPTLFIQGNRVKLWIKIPSNSARMFVLQRQFLSILLVQERVNLLEI